MPKQYLVGAKSEFSEGSRKVISCDGTEIGVFLIDGAFYAWHNECSHRNGPVCQGRLYKRVLEPVDANGETRMLAFDDDVTNIVCPWHGYEYDVKTGKNQGSDLFRLKPAKVEEMGGNIYVVL